MSTLTAPPRSAPMSLVGLLACVIAVAAAALIGTLAVSGSSQEYASLVRPSWAPPSWLFGPVWTALYASMAAAAWLVWRRVGLDRALAPFAVQLLLNAAWTPLFFGAGQYGWALVDIVALWLAIAVTIVAFWRVSRPAALLLVPYWVWVTFAAALNASILSLNR
jgi:tryptophan-rich sensory protein